MIQLSRSGLRITASAAERAALSARFRSHHVMRLPAFFDAELGAVLDRRLARAAFRPRIEDSREIEDTLDDPDLFAVYHFLLNDRRLLECVEDLTACGPLVRFTGRVYRRRAARTSGEHYYPWHDDVSEDRRVAISVNLGSAPYSGGVLEVRDAVTQAPIEAISNTGRHDAMLFRVSPVLEHRVTPVAGATPRTALAGWFRGPQRPGT